VIEQHLRAEPVGRGTQSDPSDESLITGKQLRELLGCCSEMHIWRLLNEEKNQALAFPKPVKINYRNYWRLGAVREWVREREAAPQRTSSDNLASRKPGPRPSRAIQRRTP
jgi:predicted DNA-binding transcriptional regulator AlpA